MSRIRFRFGRKKEEREKINYNIDTIIDTGNRRMTTFLVKIPGSYTIISKIIEEIAKYGKPVVKMGIPDYLSPASSNTPYLYIVVGDCDARCGSELRDVVKSVEGVEKVDVYYPEEGYIFPLYDSVMFLREESLILTAKILGGMLYDIILPSGPQIRAYPLGLGAITILTTMGKAFGKQIYDYLTKYVREELYEDFNEYVEAMLKLFSKFMKAIGVGEAEIESRSGRVYEIRLIGGAVECKSLSRYSFNGKTGYLTRGIIEGFFQELFERRIDVKETKCINKGSRDCIYIVEIMESVVSAF